MSEIERAIEKKEYIERGAIINFKSSKQEHPLDDKTKYFAVFIEKDGEIAHVSLIMGWILCNWIKRDYYGEILFVLADKFKNAVTEGISAADVEMENAIKTVAEALGIAPNRLREIAEAEREGCVYRQVYEDEAVFECSHCGATWCYECGSPIENEQHFCWRCGRPIKSIVLLERDENYELVEVEKSMAYKPVGICSGCVHRGEEICGSCARNGRGNDVDFYSKEKEK